MVLSRGRIAGSTCAGLICIALAVLLAVSFGGARGSAAGVGVPGSSLSLADDALAVPGVQALDVGQQLTAQIQAQHLNPTAVYARERSRTAFAHLDDAAVARVLREQLPSVIAAAPTGLAPGLGGGHIERYLSDDSARLALPDGKHAMVVSTGPIATRGASGAYRSLELSLHQAHGAFAPSDAAVAVRIPKTLAAGAEIPATGVSLTPVAASGTPLTGSGTLDGAAVLYPNTETDTDTVIKATPSGFETNTLLRSVDSPKNLTFHVGLPAGAVLEPIAGDLGAARVLSDGKTVAVIPTPTAQDAEGTQVPVTTSVVDGTLRLDVAHRGHDYRYPITVDPTVIDSALEQTYGANWRGSNPEKAIRGVPEEGLKFEVLVQPNYQVNESGYVLYPTQGESHIYAVNVETSGSVPANVENHLAIMGAGENGTGAWEASVPLAKSYARTVVGVCVVAGCSSSAGSAANVAAYWVNATGGYAGETGADVLYGASVYIAQNNGPSASFDTTHEHIWGNRKNVLYGNGGWIREGEGVAEVDASDPGIGVSKGVYTVTGGAKWTTKSECSGPVQCPEAAGQQVLLKNANSEGAAVTLPDGEPTVEAQAFDAMGSASGVVSAKLKVDGTAPSVQAVSGLPENGEVGDAYHALKLSAQATDGSGSTPSSGVASLKLAVDGHPISSPNTSPNGSCSPGPCTASGEWTINAEEFGAGKHVFTVIATDVAGNVGQSVETPFTVRHATPTAFGPGTVNPVTGDFDVEEADVSVATSGSSLSVVRNYDSRSPAAGAEGPLGAPWSLSVGDAQELTRNPATKSVVLTSPSGGLTAFAYVSPGHYSSPAGDKSLLLSANTGETEFTLADDGSFTTFAHMSGDSENVWRPTISTGAGGTNTARYTYQVVGGVARPLQELGPVPAGVSCSSELVRGCRALTFVYATATTATGEAPGEWGEYSARLSKVNFTAYEPAAKAMVTKAVAQYSYDTKGRLRAVWDPRVSPALKRTFGYDAEGHLTAVSPAGQEPWIFGYGTASLDTSPGRLVTAGRPVAATALGNGVAPASTVAPSVSVSQPIVGHSIQGYPGTWSNSPLRYGYQWMRCNVSGGECAAIGGAINHTYTPVTGDLGHELVLQVTATNAGGSTAVLSVATAPCATLGLGELKEYAVPGSSTTVPWAITAGPDGNLWVSLSEGPIDKVTTSGSVTEYPGIPSAKLPWGIAAGPDGNLWFTEYGTTKIGKMSTSGSLLASYEVGAGSFGVAAGPDGNMWYVSYQSDLVAKITTSGVYTNYKLPTSSNPVDIVKGPDNNMWFTEETRNKIGRITTAGAITEYALPSGSKPSGITLGPDGNLWFTEFGTNKIAKITTGGTITEYTLASGAGPESIVTGPEGQLWFTEYTADKVGSISVSGTIATYSLPAGSKPKGIAVGSDGGLWIAEYHSKKIARMSPGVTSEGSHTEGVETPLPPSATSTIEYGIPASGAGAPYALSSSEVAKWGQTDVPVEGTAMFPPDEPQGWPASDYKRATVEYLDSADRVVNVAEPGGAIATSEYNSYNDVTRTLTADNREAALKAGSKSAEVSQTLDTQSTYGSEGSELLSTLGPLHTVKLASGVSAAAREHTVYSYDEGAPAEGPYRLVTKVTSGAQIAGEPEADVRTTTKSYSGQNNLGWILREPTATRTDPSGLNLTHTTVYDPASGNVTETRTPAAGAPGEETFSGYVYRSTFGSLGSGNGQVSKPGGIALDKEGNVWVSDTENNRVEEFSSGGTFLQKFGTLGTGNGQFNQPAGITIDSEGNIWVVDSGNDRIEKFSKTGAYLSQFGSKGTLSLGAYFTSPMGIAYSPTRSRLYVADTGNNMIRVFNMRGEFEYKLGSLAGGHGIAEFWRPAGVAVDSSGNLWVADTENARIQEFNAGGGYIQQFGKPGTTEHYVNAPRAIVVDAQGNVLVADGKSRVMTYTSAGVFEFQFGSEGSGPQNMNNPEGLALDTAGDAYVADSNNNRIQKWSPAAILHESSGTGGTHGEQTIYYTAGANAEVVACGERPEWGGLPCEKRPAAQPETSGVPNLPVTTVTYNVWDEPLVSTETVGASTRTTTNTYDEAGRPLTGTVVASAGVALPTVKTEYSPETGVPVKTSTTVEGTTRTIERVFNRLGQRTSYKDADGNTSTAEFDIDGREVSASDGKGTQTFTYDPTTGFETKLVDSAAGTFTGSYDAEGDLLTAGYPNGMNVNHAFDAAGEETGVEYVKTTHCTTGCVWYSETEAPSIHGQALSETSTLASESYTYDAAGRLTQAQDTPAGEGCTTRIYAYDEETNVQSLTTRPPGGEGKCATEGGSAANHSYDAANRLTDAGIAYDAFGDITKLPAVDAGGSEVTSTYYADETLATQTQAGETIGYYLDPTGRTRQRVATGTTNSTTTLHYSGEGRAPAWTEDTLGKWTRNIPGIEGGLVAVQSNAEAPVLQIEDLQGNIVGTASLSETATGLLSKSYSTEYGVPRTSSPAKYSWMGSDALSTELPTGIIAMGARSYIPQIGRFLQPDPIEGGSANEYTYTYGDPINTSDPTGEFTVATPSWVNAFLSEQAEIATEAAIRKAAEEQAAREEAEAAAAEAEESLAEAYTGGGKKGKSGNGRAGKMTVTAKQGIALTTNVEGGYLGNACKGKGPYRCGQPGAGTKPIHEHHGENKPSDPGYEPPDEGDKSPDGGEDDFPPYVE